MPDLLRTIHRLKVMVESSYFSKLETEWINDAITLLEHFAQGEGGEKDG